MTRRNLSAASASRRWLTSIAVFAILSVTPQLAADQLELEDGSILIGSVISLNETTIHFDTSFAGEVEIDRGAVVRIRVGETVNVGLTTGDRLVGPVTVDPSTNETAVETQVGNIIVDIEQIDAIWAVGAESPAERALREALADEVDKYKPDWRFTLELGVEGTDGTTDTFDAFGRADLYRDTYNDSLNLFLLGRYGTLEDARDESEVQLGAYYEYRFEATDQRLYVYGRGLNEYDEFENIRYRGELAAGPGYYWIREEDHELKTRAGVGLRHESFLDATPDETSGLIELGLNYRLDIQEWLRFTSEIVWTPTFNGLDDYRLTNDNALRIPIGDSEIWALKFGVLFEYDPIVPPGIENLEVTYYSAVSLNID